MQHYFLKIALRLSSRLRRARMKRLLDHFSLDADTRILDVGGSGDWNWASFGIDSKVTVINLQPPVAKDQANYVQGSACDMHMFQDGEFDLVFSNSVIEHLPSRGDQQRMAAEIRRVGKAYWVQTPNRHFPVELHLCFPLVQYFPLKAKRFIARHWPFSFQKMRGKSAEADAQAILLTKKELGQLFPGAQLIGERFVGIEKSLIATRGGNA